MLIDIRSCSVAGVVIFSERHPRVEENVQTHSCVESFVKTVMSQLHFERFVLRPA